MLQKPTRCRPRLISRLPLSSALLIMIVLVFSLAAAIVMLVTSRYIGQVIFSQQEAYQASTLQIKTNSFERYLQQLETFSLSTRNDEHFMNLLKTQDELSYGDAYYILSMLKSAYYSRQDLITAKLYILSPVRSYRISKDRNFIVYGFDRPNSGDLAAASQAPSYLSVRPGNAENGELLTLSRTIININTKHALAYVEFTVDNSYLQYLAASGNTDNTVLCLLDSSSQLYYSSDPSTANSSTLRTALQQLGGQSGSLIIDIGGTRYMAVTQPSSDGSWLLLSLVSMEKLSAVLTRLRTFGLTLSAGAILLIGLGVLWSIRRLTSPLKKLALHMDTVGQGNFATITDISGTSEITMLVAQFNSMTAHIHDLIDRNYRAELKEKTARLTALEAQINPHFLYNTLQSISTKAILCGQKDIYNMINALSASMRYTIKGGKYALVSSEVKHVSDYLMLQQTRFEDRLDYHLKVDKDTLDFLVPKIILQPLAENAILHGMKSGNTPMSILIRISIDRQRLRIYVSDDGRGIPAEQLQALNAQLHTDSMPDNEIGLRNLAGRLRLLCGEDATITLSSAESGGTQVEIFLPLSRQEGENHV